MVKKLVSSSAFLLFLGLVISISLMVKKLIFASEEEEFTRPKAHAASRS